MEVVFILSYIYIRGKILSSSSFSRMHLCNAFSCVSYIGINRLQFWQVYNALCSFVGFFTSGVVDNVHWQMFPLILVCSTLICRQK